MFVKLFVLFGRVYSQTFCTKSKRKNLKRVLKAISSFSKVKKTRLLKKKSREVQNPARILISCGSFNCFKSETLKLWVSSHATGLLRNKG